MRVYFLIYIVIPKLQEALKGVLNCCKLRITFISQNGFSSVFQSKKEVPGELASDVLYKFQCGLCKKTCYCKTVR